MRQGRRHPGAARGRGDGGASIIERRDIIEELRSIQSAEMTPRVRGAPYHARCELEFRKWRLVHKLVHANPFTTDETVVRSAQWRAVVDYARDVGDMEMLDWVLQQVEVAEHREAGIQDLRPRKAGPCHPLLLEYVGNRKRKALAVYHWVEAAGSPGEPLAGSSREKAVAKGRKAKGFTSD